MKRRRLILEFLSRYIREHGYAPSVREVCEACRVPSTSAVAYHLRKLEEEGAIRRDEGVARSVRVIVRAAPSNAGGRFVVPGDRVQVDIDGFVQHGAFVA